MAGKNSRYIQIAAYIMITAIFVIIMGVTRNCGRIQTSPLEGFSGGDTIDIALIYGPGNYYLYSDSLSGINHEIAELYSRETDVPVKIWAISHAAEGMEKLESGAFDIVASLPLDNYIKNHFGVSESMFLDRLVLVQLKDSVTGEKSINSSLDLNGKTVFVQKGSSALQRIKNLSNEIGGKIEIIEDPELSDELLTIKVATGSIPYAVVNEKIARKLAETYPNLDYDNTLSFTQFQVWIFNLSDTINIQKFNHWFDNFKTTDTYHSIINTY